jgi:hypothetical protein
MIVILGTLVNIVHALGIINSKDKHWCKNPCSSRIFLSPASIPLLSTLINPISSQETSGRS